MAARAMSLSQPVTDSYHTLSHIFSISLSPAHGLFIRDRSVLGTHFV